MLDTALDLQAPGSDDLDTHALVGQVLCPAVGHPSAFGVDPGATIATDDFTAHVDELSDQVAEFGVGAVCWFPSRPAGDGPRRVTELVQRLQAVAAVPLLVGTDQEGGRVARMRDGFFVAPAAREYAADRGRIRADATRTGTELAEVGVNTVFAPIADVDSNPQNPVIGARSYGSDPDQVAGCVVAAIEGFEAAGIACCVKHFPGHGDTTVDSHLALPVIDVTPQRWAEVEAVPFRAAVAADVPMIMTGHLRVPALAVEPATFSRALLTDLLRDRWGYRGVVVSDSLLMTGARQGRTDDELVVDAFNAGVDLLLLPPSLPAAHAALVRAVEDGRISPTRLREAADRVLALKRRIGLIM
ncbi:glycoside hydrolase family 3 protein [Microlunatus sp. Y2014]|uniref:glycoside hydrolase family 3 protein n=1 Tax=Microlunatus sp. Y2014 TaxID=3418488 RepID=UPI003DA71298